MIARGDLGVRIPLLDVPAVQKKLIHRANLLGRPVITATQMLVFMTENIRPTRAEVSDVAHAIHNGFTVLEKVHDQQHGEKVAFGTLASLFLTDKPGEIINEVYALCQSVSLPSTFDGIGLGGISDEELMKVAEAACAENETIHNGPIPVEPMTVLPALKVADAEDRRCKMAVVKDR